jgi:hypothetical protein
MQLIENKSMDSMAKSVVASDTHPKQNSRTKDSETRKAEAVAGNARGNQNQRKISPRRASVQFARHI